jgi:plastocyanin
MTPTKLFPGCPVPCGIILPPRRNDLEAGEKLVYVYVQHTLKHRFFQAILPYLPSEERRHILQPARVLGLFLVVVTLLLHTSGRLSVAQSPAPSPSVTMKEFEFTPKEIKVKVGTTVTWMNAGTTAHSATAIDKSFNTRNLQPGEAKSVTFSTPGTFVYHCVFHGNPDDKSGMIGTVIVEP